MPSQDRRITADRTREIAVTHDQAVRYVRRIRSRLGSRAFHELLRVLHLYRRRLVSIAWLYRRVVTLFEGHLDLAYELEAFVPDATSVVSMRKTLQEHDERALMIQGGIGAIDDGLVDQLVGTFHS